jgi:hypothetical protein
VVERLDSIVSQIKEATEKDRAASTALLDTYRQISGEAAKRIVLLDATCEPLAAAHVLSESSNRWRYLARQVSKRASILDQTRFPPTFMVGGIDTQSLVRLARVRHQMI